MGQSELKEEFLMELTEQIRCKRARNMVSVEVSAHIDDQAQEYENTGLDKQEALQESIRQMGNPVDVGHELNKIHRPKTEWNLLIIAISLSILGIVLQYTIAKILGNWTSYDFTFKIITKLIGMFILVIIYMQDYSIIGKYAVPAWITSFMGFLIVGLFIPGSIQQEGMVYTSMTLFIPVYGGILYRYRNAGYYGVVCSLLFCLLPLVLTISFGSFTGLLELIIIGLMMLSFVIIKGWFQVKKKLVLALLWLFTAVMPSVICISWMLIANPLSFRTERLQAYMHPERYSNLFGYEAMQIHSLLSNCKWFGSSLPKHIGLSNVETNYIITFIFTHYGIFAGIIVLLLIAFLVAKAIHISLHQKNRLGSIISFGCSATLFIQTALYVGANFGYRLLAIKYIPFLSSGLRSNISNFIMIGLILSIYRNTDIIAESVVKNVRKYRIYIERI